MSYHLKTKHKTNNLLMNRDLSWYILKNFL